MSAIFYWSARPEAPLQELVSAVILAFPSTASIERMFSAAGDIQCPKRGTISHDILSNMLFLVGAFINKRARLLQSPVFCYSRQTRSDER